MDNNMRYDLSEWLIHFFRDVDIEAHNGMPMPEFIGWNNLFEYNNKPLTAFFLLRCAIRQQLLWATWSYRNNVRTIYGKKPAICFTDMPIAAFFEASEKRRARGEHISPYAIIFNKAQMAQCGTLPVIYGLSQSYTTTTDSYGARIIDPLCLPLKEQYRYVAYNPSAKYPIDWTHEREWRLACHRNVDKCNEQLKDCGVIESYEYMPGLNLDRPDLSGMGVVVSNDYEANLISYDLLSLIDRKIIDQKQFPFILSMSRIVSHESLRTPEGLAEAISQALIDPLAGLEVDIDTINNDQRLLTSLLDAINDSTELVEGEHGEVWLWLYNGAHHFSRSMIACNRLVVNGEGRYLVKVNEFSRTRALRQRQEMVTQLAASLKEQVGIDCGYFSILGHYKPDDVPFYCDPPIENDYVYNKCF